MMEHDEDWNDTCMDDKTADAVIKTYKRQNKVLMEEVNKRRMDWCQMGIALCGKGSATVQEVVDEIYRMKGQETPAGMVRTAMQVVLERMKNDGLFTDEILMMAHRMCKLGQTVAEITRAETEAKQHGGDNAKTVEDEVPQAPAEADLEGAGHQV